MIGKCCVVRLVSLSHETGESCRLVASAFRQPMNRYPNFYRISRLDIQIKEILILTLLLPLPCPTLHSYYFIFSVINVLIVILHSLMVSQYSYGALKHDAANFFVCVFHYYYCVSYTHTMIISSFVFLLGKMFPLLLTGNTDSTNTYTQQDVTEC